MEPAPGKPILDYAPPPAPKQIQIGADVVAWLAAFCIAPLFGMVVADHPGQYVGWIIAAPLAWLVRKSVVRAKPEFAMSARREWWLGAATAAFVVGFLIFTFEWKTCAHGTQFAFGPVELAHSTNGGPCGRGYATVYRHLGGDWYFVVRPR